MSPGRALHTHTFDDRNPILFNGLLIGFAASIICMIIYNGFLIAASRFNYRLELIEILYFLNASIVVIGLLLGFLGSYFSIRSVNLKVEKFL